MYMDKSKTIIAAVAIGLVLIVGGVLLSNSSSNTNTSETSPSASPSVASKNIVETAVAAGDFGTLVTAVKTAGLVETLSGPGPYTVFAPTDAAFAKLPAGTVEDLLKKPEELKKILTYHVVSGEVLAKDVVKLSEAKTVNGAVIKIATDANGNVTVNGAKVTKTDIKTSNGVIHVIDGVLLPPTQ